MPDPPAGTLFDRSTGSQENPWQRWKWRSQWVSSILDLDLGPGSSECALFNFSGPWVIGSRSFSFGLQRGEAISDNKNKHKHEPLRIW